MTGLFQSLKAKDESVEEEYIPAMILCQRSKVKSAKQQKSDSGAALSFRSNGVNYGQSPLIKFLFKNTAQGSGRQGLSFRRKESEFPFQNMDVKFQ